MHSPPAEWTLGIGYLVVLDYVRSRGEADGDTASEVVRSAVNSHPRGRLVFTVLWVAFGAWFWRHILKEN